MGEWIEWNGGEMPVEPDTLVQVQFRADNPNEEITEFDPARWWDWRHDGGANDIIAYRIAEETNE